MRSSVSILVDEAADGNANDNIVCHEPQGVVETDVVHGVEASLGNLFVNGMASAVDRVILDYKKISLAKDAQNI